jgi:4-amino-4-deoxy-L-arabinose transferase-like glycosyltransferase
MRIFRLQRSDIVVLLIICFGFVIRLLRLDIPFDPEDVHLDYLAAHQMVQFGQIPWSGSGNPLLIDSPLYYYIVTLFIWMWDHLLFLAVVNIVLIQGVTFYVFYRLATELFDRRVGVLTVLLAVTSFEYIAEGAYFFQTHVMQMFVNSAFLFLVVAYKRKTEAYALASVCLFVTALTIHHSVLALVFPYIFVLLSIMRRYIHPVGWYKAILVGSATFIIWHIPVGILFLSNASVVEHMYGIPYAGITQSFSRVWSTFTYNTAQFLSTFSLRWFDNAPMINTVLVCVLGLSLTRFLLVTTQKHRNIVGVIGLTILWFIFCASLLQKGVWNFTFSSLFGLYLMVVAASISQWFIKTRVLQTTIGIGVVGLTIYAYSNGFIFRDALTYPRLERWNITQESQKVIRKKVLELKEQENRSDLAFFRIQRVHKQPTEGFFVDVYDAQDIQIIEDLLYWPFLQRDLATRFTEMSNHGAFPEVSTTDDYIFVICDSTRDRFLGVEDCMRRYQVINPQYSFVEALYEKSPIAIVLVRKAKYSL